MRDLTLENLIRASQRSARRDRHPRRRQGRGMGRELSAFTRDPRTGKGLRTCYRVRRPRGLPMTRSIRPTWISWQGALTHGRHSRPGTRGHRDRLDHPSTSCICAMPPNDDLTMSSPRIAQLDSGLPRHQSQAQSVLSPATSWQRRPGLLRLRDLRGRDRAAPDHEGRAPRRLHPRGPGTQTEASPSTGSISSLTTRRSALFFGKDPFAAVDARVYKHLIEGTRGSTNPPVMRVLKLEHLVALWWHAICHLRARVLACACPV